MSGEMTADPPSSIRDSSPADHEKFRRGDDDTFYDLLSIHLDQPVGSMSISPASRDVALGARKGLYIVDLQNPYDPPRFLPHHSAWEVADVQWNPFHQRSEWVASTSNQNAVVYNLSLSPSLSTTPIEHTLSAHVRAISDINWSPAAPEILATCGLDGRVWAWDLRTGYGSKSGAGGGRKPVWGVCSFGTGATQVKWNRREPHIIASAHDKKVFVWDDRMGAKPVTTIEGHTAKIYGIDWSREQTNKIVTCSLDRSFRSWTLNDVATPDLTVITTSPVWRARYLPFGRGVLTLPQRSDHALSIWGREKVEQGNTAEPVARFMGATAGVKEFVWRTRGGDDLDSDDRQFQLVTWAKDRRLRLWPISEEILKGVGHVRGAPITIPMTRRGGADISYRTFAETPAPPNQPIAFTPTTGTRPLPPTQSLLTASRSPPPPTGPSLLTSSLLTAGFSTSSPHTPAPSVLRETLRGAATMTTTSVRNRRQKAHDRLAWMEGVKVLKPSAGVERHYGVGVANEGMESRTETRASSMVRGTDGGTAREGGETERAESVVSGSKATTTVPKENLFANLGEEITAAVRKFPRITFEKVHIAGRTCTVSLYSPMFLRATFSFPKTYPASTAPSLDIERTNDISLKSRAFLLQNIRKLMANRSHRGLPSLEMALKFLLGDRSDLDNKASTTLDDDDDDDEDGGQDALAGLSLGPGAVPADILRNNLNVPPPRRGGATFSATGQLVVFFPTNVFVVPADKEGPTPLQDVSNSRTRAPPRVSEAFGKLPNVDRDSSIEDEYQETDEALQMPNGHSFRSLAVTSKPAVIALPSTAPPPFSTIVHIKDFSHLTLVHPSRATLLSGPPLDIAQTALAGAILLKDAFLAQVWTTLVCFLDQSGDERTKVPLKHLDSALAERLLPELLTYLLHLRDVQTAGVIACLIESYRRSLYESPLRPAHPPKTPSVDYFSHRLPSTDSNDVSTPRARTKDLHSSHSPKPSWANLAGLFNSSMLSLRSGSGTSSTPGSPEIGHDRGGSPTFFHPAPPPTPGSLPRSPMAGARSVGGRSSNEGSPDWRKESFENSVSGGGRPSLSRMNSSRLMRSTGGGSARVSPTVSFGGTKVNVIEEKGEAGVGGKEEAVKRRKVTVTLVQPVGNGIHPAQPVPWWLTQPAQIKLEAIRLAYAELLDRWGLAHERVQVLKLCRSTSGAGLAAIKRLNGLPATVSIQTVRMCTSCGAGLQPPYAHCQTCRRRQRKSLCVLCHLPLQNLSQTCTTCLHIGHLDCLRPWYSVNDSCPSGCGCSCVSSGGTSGMFLAPAPLPPASTAKTVDKPAKFRPTLPFFTI